MKRQLIPLILLALLFAVQADGQIVSNGNSSGGGGGSGTVASGTQGQIGTYASTGTTISGSGPVTGAVKVSAAGVASQAACADLSNGAASCSTDTTNASNITSGTLAKAQGGSSVTYGAPQTSILTGASGTYTVPTGATWLDVCLFGAGGGGGAATSGGSAAHGAGTGGMGGESCYYVTGTLAGSYTYTNQTGGTPGTCSASPSGGGNATGTTAFGSLSDSSVALAGNLATVSADGAGGTGGAPIGSNKINIGGSAFSNGYASMTGATGAGGSAGTIWPVCGNGGACGGAAATVNASGACVQAATAGQNGFIVVRAYFN